MGPYKVGLKYVFIAGIAALTVAIPVSADAAPTDYRRVQVYVHPTFGADRFLGNLGDTSSWSVGFGLTQGIQWRWFGVNLTVATDYFLTRQQPPPFNTGVQTATVRLSGRFLLPIWDVRLFAEPAVGRSSVISIALIDETGPQLHFHTVGGRLGVRYMGMDPLYLELGGGIDYAIELHEPLGHIGFSVGILSLL